MHAGCGTLPQSRLASCGGLADVPGGWSSRSCTRPADSAMGGTESPCQAAPWLHAGCGHAGPALQGEAVIRTSAPTRLAVVLRSQPAPGPLTVERLRWHFRSSAMVQACAALSPTPRRQGPALCTPKASKLAPAAPSNQQQERPGCRMQRLAGRSAATSMGMTVAVVHRTPENASGFLSTAGARPSRCAGRRMVAAPRTMPGGGTVLRPSHPRPPSDRRWDRAAGIAGQ